jgi:nucleoside-diphosphate-sugar epimerase
MSPARDSHILITGGAGYIGSALCGTLLQRGFFVTVIDKLMFGGEPLLPYFHHPCFHFHLGDVCETDVLGEALKGAYARGAPALSVVVHLAGIVGFPACEAMDKDRVWRENVEAVKVVFEQADALGAPRLIFSSTYSNYGVAEDGLPVTENADLHPQSLYAETKIAAEEFLQQSSHSSSVAPLIYRFTTLYGPSPRMRFDLIINQFVLEAHANGELLIYQRNFSRSFVHIQDVIRGILLGIKAPEERVRGEIYNLGSSEGNYTKDEIVSLIGEVLPDTRVRYDDLNFDGDMRDVQVSFEKITNKLGFVPRHTVREGIEDVMRLLNSGLIRDPFSERFRNAQLGIKEAKR